MSDPLTTPETRVAFISQCLGRIVPPQAHGSIAIWTYETARHLSKEFSVTMMEAGEKAFRTQETEHEGMKFVYVGTALNRAINAVHRRLAGLLRRFWSVERRTRCPAYTSLFHNLGFSLLAAWQARRFRCNIIHVHNYSQFVPVMRALNPSAKIIIHMNCEWLSQHEPRMIERRLRSADVIVGCSGHISGRIVERFPALKPKCQVVYNGSNVERLAPVPESGESSQDLRVLFVGRISPEKGVHLLVDAFKAIAEEFPSAQLDLVGGAGSMPAEFLVALSDDPLVRGLQSFYQCDYLADIQGRIPDSLKKRVHFHGNVAHRELAQHYRRASVFVNPSLSDAFPLTVVEAMAAELPVVASAVGGVPESVADGVTGLLVEPDSAEALADGLRRLLGDEELRRRMAPAARERALKLFSWQAIAKQIGHVYRAALAVETGGSRRMSHEKKIDPMEEST
jgi:glycosyltransferase involved in cell wall biosynthesis